VRDLGEIAARIRAVADDLRDRFDITRIGVFGSFAQGQQTQHSDVDLLVEMSHTRGLRFVAAARFVEQLLERKVDFVRPEILRPDLSERVLEEVVYVWQA